MAKKATKIADITQRLESEIGSTAPDKQAYGRVMDRLRDKFEPEAYVTISNPFGEPTGWIYTDPADENTVFDGKERRTMKIRPPRMRILQSSELKVVSGAEAYVALNRMFNDYAQRKKQLSIMLGSVEALDQFLSKVVVDIKHPGDVTNLLSEATRKSSGEKTDDNATEDEDVPSAESVSKEIESMFSDEDSNKNNNAK